MPRRCCPPSCPCCGPACSRRRRTSRGGRVFAFAGIGRPAKFFATLAQAGAHVAGQRAFPDHHRYRPAELHRLARRADALGAVLVTTPKDAVRLPPEWRDRVDVAGVSLRWTDDTALEALLGDVA